MTDGNFRKLIRRENLLDKSVSNSDVDVVYQII